MESRDLITKNLISIRDYMRWAVSNFTRANIYYGHGTDNAWDEALQLVLYGLNLPQDIGSEILDARLTPQERNMLMVLFETRIIERIPVPYLTGTAWFAGLPFKVDERVIVPRSPIAELIQNEFIGLIEQPPKHALDLCCGSACIGIATAYAFAEAEVDVVDLSADALELAQENIEMHGLVDRVFPMQSNLFEGIEAHGQYDLILCNPPYVDAEDLADMPAEFHHEPEMALGSGDDGLSLSHQILAQAASYLTPNGVLVLEVGNSCLALEQAYPGVSFDWIEFEHGGLGVCCLTQQHLKQFSN